MGNVLVIEHEKCTGCQMCETACSTKHAKQSNPERARIRVVKTEEEGQLSFVPSACMQCETAMCEMVCPAGAISRVEATGARVVDERRCLACSSCSYACPFAACFVDRKLKRSVLCNQCDGDSTCAKICPSGALQYLSEDQVNINLRRDRAQLIVEARKNFGKKGVA